MTDSTETKPQIVYVLVCGDGSSRAECMQVTAVYTNEKVARDECAKRNDYEACEYGDRSEWVYAVQEHILNSVYWKH